MIYRTPVYRFLTESKLYGLEDPIGEVPVMNVALQEHQNNIVHKKQHPLLDVQYLDSISTEKFILFYDHTYFTEAFFDQLVLKTKDLDYTVQVCLKENSFNNRFLLPTSLPEQDDVYLDFYYVVKQGDTPTTEAIQGCPKIYLDQEIIENHVTVPPQLYRERNYSMPQTSVFAGHILTPFHLLQINVAVNLARTVKKQQNKMFSYFRNLSGYWGARLYSRGLRSMNKIGKNCMIHPTAVIEGSVIGDGVKIGAHSIVRLSVIGDNSEITDNVVVANSVLGESCYISNNNYVDLCLLYDEVFLIHGPYQFSVFGKNSAVFATINCDFRMDQKTIKIASPIGMLDSRQAFLGIAYGHRSKVAGGNIIAAGRVVPNDHVQDPPDNIIFKF